MKHISYNYEIESPQPQIQEEEVEEEREFKDFSEYLPVLNAKQVRNAGCGIKLGIRKNEMD